jgi:hypothetical protein
MDKLYEIKDMLCEELEEYSGKDKLDVGSLDVIDKLAHAIKNIDKIIENYEGEYSNNSYGSYDNYRGGSNRYSRRGRKRDSMGRYSREHGYSRAEDDFRMELEDMMNNAPNEQTRQKLQRMMNEM